MYYGLWNFTLFSEFTNLEIYPIIGFDNSGRSTAERSL